MRRNSTFQSKRPALIRLLSIALAVFSLAACGSIHDIRPDSVLDGIDEDESARGHAALERAARNAGGKELLLQHAGFETEMTDTWSHWMGKMLFLRYEEQQEIAVKAAGPRVDDVRLSIIGGERDGEVWGVEGDKVFTQRPGESREYTDDEVTMLYIKNPAALVLTPLRLAYADQVSSMEPITYEGKTYDRVFVTWERLEPNLQYDQWLVWIDRESGNIAKAQLTIREYTGMAVKEAVAEFSDYRTFGDVTIPTRISALFELEDNEPIRTWTVNDFRWVDANNAQAEPATTPTSAPYSNR